MKKLMIYGATGYTGAMIARHAQEAGLTIIIAGRDREKLAAMASELKVAFRAFSLNDPDTIDGALEDIDVLINCAGPFMHTARPLMSAAIRQKVHYLDVAAELDSYQLAEIFDDAAVAAGVMLLPGCGGSVAMLGCLAAHAAGEIKNPVRISLALHVTGAMSRGSAVSASENLSTECLLRRSGQLMQRESTELQNFDFGKGPQACFPVTLPDVITIWKATAIPDIETFVYVSGDGFPQGDLADLPDGPTAQEREASRYQAVAEVENADGDTLRMLLDTVNGYSFTALAAAEAGRRVLAGEYLPGFQTPAALFGKQFAETIADTRITLSDNSR
ncbi:saccharopine dehydrogenase NADP-binding domain-containing protein [Enterobacter cloacae]|uniref:saccharopine dehydrogenase family protein n=2 Tax=Enterobacterales TaxID=91347 RepID=UPI0004E26E86|nr:MULTISPECIES: saccharopine dehydrogenase NADP-binding domain-containing protein [Enterobacteriaceae]ALD78181.1 INTEGRAL MEMBRANE PROTEIN (Rhomboid family) [Citrobacter portucalensis]MCI1182414.1 saccharopine dehydrogenase NADP-binding domain-containing protein [Enterobacter cloacae]MCT9035482.1 saccharopine dehydrogenase NADP-binding domain-containing protein [Enterobacter cloacae]MDT7481934.1 saccharopine dehydrogenase NADP-binding domain-containing protein [Citrobacter portucalensis]MDT74